MDSRRASYFLAVVDAGSFSAAARNLHLSQPALSAAVRELEAVLGCPLLERLGRGVILTPSGRAFEPHARRALVELDAADAAVREVIGLAGGSLTVCCLPSLAADPMAGAVGRLRLDHPDVAVTVLGPEDADELVELLRRGRAELGLTDASAIPADLERLNAGRQELLVIQPPGSDDHGTISVEQLAERDLVAFPGGASTRAVMDQAFVAAGVIPQIAVEVTARDAAVPLVLAGAGAALVPAPLADLAAARGAVVARTEPPLTRQLVLAHRIGPLSPAAARLAALLCDEVVSAGQTRPL